MIFQFIIFACSTPQERENPNWFSIDPHVHSSIGSNDTDGLGTPHILSQIMNERKLDVVWLTDHSNSLGSMECVDVEDCPNQGPEFPFAEWEDNVWLGVEISPRSSDNLTPTGHIGCLPMETSFEHTIFIDRPFDEINGENILDQCHEAGGWSILNHPFGPADWVSFDWSSTNFNAMEVYNGSAGFDQSDWKAIEQWELLIAEGHSIVPIGASDSHRWNTNPPGTVLDSALGWPRTEVGTWSNEISKPDIQKGVVMLGDPSVHLRYSVNTSNGVFWPGEISESGRNPVMNISYSSTEESPLLEVRLITTNQITTVFTAIPTSQTQQVQIPIATHGHYYVRIRPAEIRLGAKGYAMGNVIMILP